MSDDEKKDKPSDADKPAKTPTKWEDSHTAASLPGWWQPEADETKPTEAQPPAPQSTTGAPTPAAAPPPPMPPSSAPTQPPAPADWQVSGTAKDLPAWWRPGQAPSTPEAHAAPTVPPTPHAEAPMPPAPMPPVVPQAPPMPPMQSAPPEMQPPPMPHAASAPPQPPQPPQPPPSRYEKTMVLGVMPAAASPMAILIVRSGPDLGFKFRLKPTGVASVGRDLENEVVLDDPAASRRHAQIEFKGGAYVLTDLGSINGTLVNAQRVTSQKLADGDRIVIGQNEILISIMGTGM